MPPTQPGPRHETIISDTISPVCSEYPDLGTPFPPSRKKSYDKSLLRWGHDEEGEPVEEKKRRAKRPPPLNLEKTHMMYPPSSVDVVIDPSTLVNPFPPQKQAPPLPRKIKPRKKLQLVEDPFEVAEVEIGHRYLSWKGGKADIRPGQVIPSGLMPSLVDLDVKPKPKPKPKRCGTVADTPDNYESVLHNVLLTPTYIAPSPQVNSTPTLSPYDPSEFIEKYDRPCTLLDRATGTISNAAKRTSKWMPRKSILRNGPNGDDGAANESLRALKERELQEMARFRQKARPTVRLAVPSDAAYSSGSSPMRELSNVYSRKSPGWLGSRGRIIGYDRDGKYPAVVGISDKGRRVWKRDEEHAKRNKRIWKIAIILTILFLAALTIGLCTSLLRKSSSSSSNDAASADNSSGSATATPSAASVSSTSSQTLSTCLNLFTSSAPTSPASYPCSDCVQVLQSTTNDFSEPIVNGNSTGVGSALQFCAMMDIYSHIENTSGLSKWGEDASPCGWDGIACDSRGRITILSLQYPNVPTALADTLGNVYALKALHLIGNSSVPTGNFPSSLLSLPYFQTLDLEYTAITGRIDTAPFSSATELTTLMLVSNSQLGTSMPDLSSNTKLVTAAVTGQGLADAKADKLPSSLTYLDLSYNSLSGQIPPLSQLTSLKTLYLQSNDFTSAPDSLPSSLTTMSFTSNSRLSGAMPSSVCSSTVLTSCDLRSTNLTAGMTSSSSRSSLSSHMSSVTASSTITSMASTSGTSVKASGSAMSSVSSSSGSSSAASDTSVKSSTMIGVSARASTEGTCGVCQFN
ncbi:hypothetical protein C351_05006 [Cryptococcus neoformans c8]|nr:hypothetical protein C353_05124 [Cryptococcus neoformans var. grubii AD1-83a]OXG53466.1 hypothetical protein C354_05062 [Cryptococcus neoformans var. grubii MW-RSA1955]OXG60304.1 hypothetical protein C351_05006 [Cryptococcus neoformans var. grubii c8]OXH06074.1 hypothetical protein C369_05131 [Cryptococcus neoformans var. grubii A5-35-17]OXH07176.1 hypothetical protein C370_05254 [Cryptococcus neoformans var. grubii A1-35-8]